MAAAERLSALLAAAGAGDCGSSAARAVREAARVAIIEAAVEMEPGQTDIVSVCCGGEPSAEQYAEGFAALNDPSLDEAVLTDLLAELSSAESPPAWVLLSVPVVTALAKVMCRRSVAIHALPRAFPRFQSELCLLCVQHALNEDSALACDMLDAAQVFVRATADTSAARKQLGASLLEHAVASAQLLRLSNVEVGRLVDLLSSCSMIATETWVQLYDHMCLELGTNSPRAIDEPEVQAVVKLLQGVAAASLKLRQGIFTRSTEILALSSRPNVRETCLRLMVRVVGTQRALVVSKLSELSRSEPTIAMRHTCLTLIRTCFDDELRAAHIEMNDSGDSRTSASASNNLQQALRAAGASLSSTATDDASPKVRRTALAHAVAIALDMDGDAAGCIKLAASRCFDTSMEVRAEALSQLVHAMKRFPEVVAGLRPPIGMRCSMPWHDLVLQLLAHQRESAADAEATAKKQAAADWEGDATDEYFRTSDTSRQVAYVCEAVLTQPALLGLDESATVDSAICSLRLSRNERHILGKVLGRAILRLSNAHERGRCAA